jgi:Arc/MetJ-type ribon-helix-helix transcriptional regulator
MPSPKRHSLRENLPMLVLLYAALAGAWGWRLQASKQPPVDETLQATRVEVVKRIAKLPPRRLNPALFQLGMLPEGEVKNLARWMAEPSTPRLRQLTVQQGPIGDAGPLIAALILAEVQRRDAPALDEMRLLVSAAGDRLEEPVKMEVLGLLAHQATETGDLHLATDIWLRITESPAATWSEVEELVEAARAARRPAAALKVVKAWLDDAKGHLTSVQLPKAQDMQIQLLIEGGRVAEASRIARDALRALPAKSAVPEIMLERALRASTAAAESGELLPWIERRLREHPEHASTWEQLAAGRETSPSYRHWLWHAASISDLQNLHGTACELFFRVAAIGDLKCLGRLHVLAAQTGRSKDFATLIESLQKRPQDALSLIDLARALEAGGAAEAGRDLLAAHLKTQPEDRDATFAMTEIDEASRGPGSSMILWEGFLRKFPEDDAALRRLAALQIADGQHLPALRSLQRIASENLAEADLRHIATLGEILDDTSTALQARQMIVERQEKPSVADLMAIAALTPQHDDPALAQTALAAAAEKAPQSQLLGEWLQNSRLGTAGTFSTAIEQVKPAIEVPQEE